MSSPSPAAPRDALAFLRGVSEHLGYYVYTLVDPRNREIFYVGKGKGDRVYQHARLAKKVPGGESTGALKLERIRAIHRAGREVGVEIIRHGLTEEVAFEVEAAVMDVLAISGLDLTNLAGGQGTARGWRPLEDIIVGYAATPVEIAAEHRVLLIRVRREFRHGISAQELYEKTREWWKVAPRRKPDYAFAVYDGIVRAVYRIDEWIPWVQPVDSEPLAHMKGRWAFRGERDAAMEDRYVWKEVTRYLTHGAQNPIRYVNC